MLLNTAEAAHPFTLACMELQQTALVSTVISKLEPNTATICWVACTYVGDGGRSCLTRAFHGRRFTAGLRV